MQELFLRKFNEKIYPIFCFCFYLFCFFWYIKLVIVLVMPSLEITCSHILYSLSTDYSTDTHLLNHFRGSLGINCHQGVSCILKDENGESNENIYTREKLSLLFFIIKNYLFSYFGFRLNGTFSWITRCLIN